MFAVSSKREEVCIDTGVSRDLLNPLKNNSSRKQMTKWQILIKHIFYALSLLPFIDDKNARIKQFNSRNLIDVLKSQNICFEKNLRNSSQFPLLLAVKKNNNEISLETIKLSQITVWNHVKALFRCGDLANLDLRIVSVSQVLTVHWNAIQQEVVNLKKASEKENDLQLALENIKGIADRNNVRTIQLWSRVALQAHFVLNQHPDLKQNLLNANPELISDLLYEYSTYHYFSSASFKEIINAFLNDLNRSLNKEVSFESILQMHKELKLYMNLKEILSLIRPEFQHEWSKIIIQLNQLVVEKDISRQVLESFSNKSQESVTLLLNCLSDFFQDFFFRHQFPSSFDFFLSQIEAIYVVQLSKILPHLKAFKDQKIEKPKDFLSNIGSILFQMNTLKEEHWKEIGELLGKFKHVKDIEVEPLDSHSYTECGFPTKLFFLTFKKNLGISAEERLNAITKALTENEL